MAYIPKEALGSAVVVALGCDEIYLQPTARFGDVRPTEGDSERPGERVSEDVVRHYKDALTTLAKRKNRPGRDRRRDGRQRPRRSFRSRTAAAARSGISPMRKFTNRTANGKRGCPLPESGQEPPHGSERGPGTRAYAGRSLRSATSTISKLRLGIPPEVNVAEAKRTWVDSLVFWLNTDLALFFLVVVGFICIYIELHLMTGALSIVAALCFALFFWSHFLGGTAGWLEVVLFLIGVICLALEMFVLPGYGVFGVTGVSADFCVADSGQPDLEQHRAERELPPALVDAGNVGRVASVRDYDCRFDEPISAPCSRLRPLDAVSARRNWRCERWVRVCGPIWRMSTRRARLRKCRGRSSVKKDPRSLVCVRPAKRRSTAG